MDLDSLERRLDSIEELLRMLLLTNVAGLTDGKYNSDNGEQIKALMTANNLLRLENDKLKNKILVLEKSKDAQNSLKKHMLDSNEVKLVEVLTFDNGGDVSRRESTIRYCVKNGTKVSKDNIVAYIISKGYSGFMSSRIIKTEHTGYFFTILPEQTVLKHESIIGIVLDKKVDLIKATKIYHNLLRMQG